MEKIIITEKQFDLLLQGYQISVEDIVKEVGQEYILTDNNREQIAICVFTYLFPKWSKSLFIRSDWREIIGNDSNQNNN